MQNFNNPYGYPYSIPSQPKTNQYAFVNGIEGAKSFQVQPNQMVMLLDSDNPIVYKKIANSFGQATISCFKMVEINENELKGINNQSSVEYATKAEFEALQKKLDELYSTINTNKEEK